MGQKIFITSDTHYAHSNICLGISKWSDKSGCRNFKTLDEMNDSIVKGINDTVGTDDILFHLGDFSFGNISKYREFRSRINCQTIYLIYGNHDGWIIRNDNNLQDLFTECAFYREVTFNGQKMIMSHYGFRVWNCSHEGSWMLYGHSHNTLKPSVAGHVIKDMLDKKRYNELRMLAEDSHPKYTANGKTMDVGIDTHPEFRPYSFDEIFDIMKSREIITVDHHVTEK